jgi:hypothetical protein
MATWHAKDYHLLAAYVAWLAHVQEKGGLRQRGYLPAWNGCENWIVVARVARFVNKLTCPNVGIKGKRSGLAGTLALPW